MITIPVTIDIIRIVITIEVTTIGTAGVGGTIQNTYREQGNVSDVHQELQTSIAVAYIVITIGTIIVIETIIAITIETIIAISIGTITVTTQEIRVPNHLKVRKLRKMN